MVTISGFAPAYAQPLSHVPVTNREIADDFSPHLYNEDAAKSLKSLPDLPPISKNGGQGVQNTCESALALICGWGVVAEALEHFIHPQHNTGKW